MIRKLIRVDKNGTKIFHDWTCPRCGGAGQSDKWLFTGKVCYECGGTGKRATPKVVKEFTEEYAAKLEARRIARAAKYAEDHADEIAQAKAEQEAQEVAWRKAANERTCMDLGCGADGVGYVLTGNTYPVKDQIKANGGKWVSQTWVCPVAFEAKGVTAVRIDLNQYINEYGHLSEYDARDAIWELGGRK